MFFVDRIRVYLRDRKISGGIGLGLVSVSELLVVPQDIRRNRVGIGFGL